MKDANDNSIDLRGDYGWDDLTPETQAQILEDCADFQAAHWQDISSDLERAGHDFYFTRNRHGVGFWDGDWPTAVGRTLTEASHPYGEFTLMLGDDGRIYS